MFAHGSNAGSIVFYVTRTVWRTGIAFDESRDGHTSEKEAPTFDVGVVTLFLFHTRRVRKNPALLLLRPFLGSLFFSETESLKFYAGFTLLKRQHRQSRAPAAIVCSRGTAFCQVTILACGKAPLLLHDLLPPESCYFLFTSAIFMARTFSGRPKRVINPSAS